MAKGRKTGGRKKGTPNKTDARTKAAVARFVEDNLDRFRQWLDRVAEDNPKEAFNMVKDLLEYNVPKLARTEHTGEAGEPLSPHKTVNIIIEKKGDEVQ